MTIPLWFSLVVFLILIAKSRELVRLPEAPARATIATGSQQTPQMIARCSLLLVVCLLFLSSSLAIRGAQEMTANRATAHDYLLTLTENPGTPVNDSILYRLYPLPRVVAARYPFLLSQHLSLYRKQDTSNP